MAPGQRPAPHDNEASTRRTRHYKGTSFEENDHEKYKVSRSSRQRSIDDGETQVTCCDKSTSTRWPSVPTIRPRTREVLLTPHRKVDVDPPPYTNRQSELRGKKRYKQRMRQEPCFTPPTTPCMRSRPSSNRYSYLRDDVDDDLNIDFLRPTSFKMADCSRTSQSFDCNRRATCCSCQGHSSRSCYPPNVENDPVRQKSPEEPYSPPPSDFYNHRSFQSQRPSLYGDSSFVEGAPQSTDMQRIRYDLDCLAQDIERLSNDICEPLLNAMRVIEQTKNNKNGSTYCWCNL